MFFDIVIPKSQIDSIVQVQLIPTRGVFLLMASPIFDSNSTNYPNQKENFKYVSKNNHLLLQVEEELNN